MPRKRRPGPRENRSDLPPVTSQVAPGRAYGERKTSEEAVQAVPLPQRPAPSDQPTGGGPGGGPGAPPPGAGGDMFAQMIDAARQMDSPGQGMLGDAPSNPEDITSGLPVGAGPGPEVLGGTMPTGRDPSVLLWAQWLPALSQLAAQPGSSPEIRQFVRRLRSQIPPDYYEENQV